MRLQSAVEFLTTYSWAFLIISLLFITVFVLILSPSQGTTAYAPESCYLTFSIPCYQAAMFTNSTITRFIVIIQNNLGVNLLLPPNSLLVTPGYFQNTTYVGSCLPQNAIAGSTIICNATLTGFGASVGSQLNPKFTISYEICDPICMPKVYNTTGSAVTVLSPYKPVIFKVTLLTNPINGQIAVGGVPYSNGTTVYFISGQKYPIYAIPPTTPHPYYFNNWTFSINVILATANQSTTATTSGAGSILASFAYPTTIPIWPLPPDCPYRLNCPQMMCCLGEVETCGSGCTLTQSPVQCGLGGLGNIYICATTSTSTSTTSTSTSSTSTSTSTSTTSLIPPGLYTGRGTSDAETGSFTITLPGYPVNGHLIVLTTEILNVYTALDGGYNGYVTVTGVSETGVTGWTMEKLSQVHWVTGSGQTAASWYVDTEIWVGVVGSGAQQTITVSDNGATNGAVTYYDVGDATDFSGLKTSSFLDKTASATSSTGVSLGSTGVTGTTTYPNELWIGAIGIGGGLATQGSPGNYFTLIDGASYDNELSLSQLYYMSSATGLAGSTTTWGGAMKYAGAIATLVGS